ncbi:MAG: alpha/beta hydrolase [Chloroflexota bacterium]|nr:alpha/beta hydrolase [Chloroflexota bacterium]
MTYRLAVRRIGRSGAPIVLLHGLGASGRSWRLVVEQCQGAAMVICPDLLGFGSSPRPAIAYSVADHLAALDAMLDRLDLGDAPVVLGGQSAGAALALEWAAARPERFRAVALMALPAYRSAAEARACIASLGPLAWATVAQPGIGELICGVMCAGRPLWRTLMPVLMPGVPADIAREMVLHDWMSYSGTLTNVLIDHRLTDAAARLAGSGVPVRLLHGSADKTAPLSAVQGLAATYAWPLTVLPGAGHRVVFDHPGACAALLRTV